MKLLKVFFFKKIAFLSLLCLSAIVLFALVLLGGCV